MHCPTLKDLPSPPLSKSGWPWTEQSKILPDITPDGQPWPKISIVTPSYNQGKFIEECIRSVLLQGYPDLEYIIIDGGSSDETVDVIKKYEPWLTYWESKSDRGQSHAINKGLEKSTGKLFNWHNSDDMLVPNAVGIVAEIMIKHPEAGYAHGYPIIINENGTVQNDKEHNYEDKFTFLPMLLRLVSDLKAGCQPGCLIDRQLLTQLGGVDEHLHYIMDVDILLRLALVKPFVRITKPVSYVRVYPGIKTIQWNEQRAKERLFLARKIFSRSDLSEAVRRVRRMSFASAHRFAWQCYAKMNRYGLFTIHFLLDVYYSCYRGWGRRIELIKELWRE
jgi:glycosyltransferase involved in cell wall biosynthesis